MPDFADLLKEARTGRVQVFHEFLTNFDATSNRLHCFYEGREDEVFYRNFILPRTQAKLIPYICGKKDDVYGVLGSIAAHPGYRQALFFVDKDLADVMDEGRPTDPRLFVTSYYSIENYLVELNIFTRFCRDFIQCRGIDCDHEKSEGEFGKGLAEFYKLILPLMAWIVAVRRRGQKPNLRNIQLATLFHFDEFLQLRRRRSRLAYLCIATGVQHAPGIAWEMRRALIELRGYHPKCVVRGHFESWFFVEYIKAFFEALKAGVSKRGGNAAMIPAVEHSSFVSLATPHVRLPNELNDFLNTCL